MSLNWDLTKIENREQVTTITVDGEKRMAPLTEALIFATMAVGIGEITEANAAEFAGRLMYVQKTGGPFLIDGEGKDKLITARDVAAHIGLRCNVSYESPTKWRNRMVKQDLDRLIYAAEQEIEKEAQAA